MATVHDVAEYILGKTGEIAAMKVQKLCYYAQAWHLVWEERPLFSERIEAWANGPIMPDLYAQHRGKFLVKAGDFPGDPHQLDSGERESIDLVLDQYGKFTAHQLSRQTHQEEPWRSARLGLELAARSNNPITNGSIYEYYGSLPTLNETRHAEAQTPAG
ncbi:MAG: Panacea domain-containing protein [Angustibacter sp.]